LETFEKRERRVPVIFYSNHSSWWDGVVAFLLWRAVAIDCYVMMEEKHLARLPLFRRAGAFSVDRESPRSAARSVNYAANLLREKPNRGVWIFPQGEILPNEARPLIFYHGISRLVEKTGECLTVPAAMRFEFLGEFKPQAFIKLGAPERITNEEKLNRKELTARFEGRLTHTLEELKSDLINRGAANYLRIV
jgi:1-acyl-sn-glycerol-3-phosphate acyltransferase